MTKESPNSKSTSKKIQYIDTSLGYPFKTPIYYQLEEKNGISIVHYYLNDKIASSRKLNRKLKIKGFQPENHGGQNLFDARYQREECLVNLIKSLFERFEFEVILQPTLGLYTPDIRISKNNFTYYIEVKAFHGSYICGDPEICQCLRYYDHAEQLSEHAKVMLITSGDLIHLQDSFLSYPTHEPLKVVEKFYKEKIIPRRQATTLDLLSSRYIYRQATKRFKKKFTKNLSTIKVEFLKNRQVENFPECLTKDNNFEVLLIRAPIFRKLLYQFKMFKEMNKFDTLRKESLERLIMNANLLKI